MGAVVKFLKETYGKTTVLGAIKAGGWKNLFDGNLAESTLVHTPGATLVGTDANGNKYYERMTEQFGRHRWVVFKNLDWLTGQDATTVPAEWHGWLHMSLDANPVNGLLPQKAIYGLPQKGYVSATASAYIPKGSWKNPSKRNWKKVEVWDPAQA